jgi:hypothetical protein
VGLPGSNEGGLTYSGRTFRVDARHAFALGKAGALSVGLGASGLVDAGPFGPTAGGFYGGGADVPVLVGLRSTGGLYSFWFGPRGGFDILSAHSVLSGPPSMPTAYDVTGKHFYVGLTAGMRVGFRHVHLALEINAAYHHADGAFTTHHTDPMDGTVTTSTLPTVNLQQLSLTPAGALEVTF